MVFAGQSKLKPAPEVTRADRKDTMTRQQMYRELEKLYCNTDWSNKDSVRLYNETAREYRKMVAEQEEKERKEARR